MALSAAAAAALKKLAATAATDKKVSKVVGGIAIGVVIVIITPLLALMGVFKSGSQIDFPVMAAQAENEQLAYFESVMLAIEDEITAQGLQADPLRAQMIYLCALQGREGEEDFYTNYISCFADGQDVFLGVSETFGVTFSADDIEKIGQLVDMAQEAQTGPPNNIHARIAEFTADDDTPLPEGDFLSPLHGRDWKPLLTSGFGVRIHPITGERSFHTGVDLAISDGTSLYPAQAGKVLIVDENDGFGRFIIVYHGGGMATMYAHCSAILVGEGDEVTTDTVIARSGNTGVYTTGPHLHFEIIDRGKPVSPTKYLQKERQNDG